ncbi:hypothetical protein J5J10_13815 [Ciceribacter sp. L1K23]|uniref:plant virulence effector HPE1-like domain-containing protein n=1 Tax=Ciceribacter sp. L1K23 TaxID=2820276 RepID=UPI001B842DE8|nr:plant virulence effector HPE1-like domain-containing protein [Ciceribacter sp. L1K23]MBR0556759.1 hypothetical protein [Ciceribacter sp. L1K23]
MRHLMLAAIATLSVAAPAAASSIEVVASASVTASSITQIGCQSCPPLKPREGVADYVVPALPAGAQKVEMVERDGQRTLLRTESWMGGSPVVFVSKAPYWETGASGTAMAMASEIDRTATTAAIDQTKTLDLASFELRLP